MFRVNPAERPSINDVVERLEEIGEAKNIKLTGALPQSLLTDPSIQPGTEKKPYHCLGSVLLTFGTYTAYIQNSRVQMHCKFCIVGKS